MTRPKRASLIGLAALLILAGCGAAEPDRDLSPQAAAGREVALDKGCAACHGSNGEGGVGPPWIGLAGSTVELEGGGTVVADAGYLRRSIVDPEAEVVAGWTVKMPVTELSDDEVNALIAYIQELR
jgi:cytochrome c oxidase subunit 2